MDLEELRSFVAVVEHGGFRAAADELFLSQPSLSRRIQHLEGELGVRLLDRGPWGLRLTGHGETLLQGARRILGTVADVRAATIGTWGDTLRLGAAATAAGSYLASFLSVWIPAHPELKIEMIEDGALRMSRRLADGQCDVGIVATPVPDEFDHLPITTVSVLALVPPSHPLAEHEESIGPADLDGESLLMNGRPFLSAELTRAACQVSGSHPHVVYECSVGQTLAALAEAGLGIAIISDNVDLRGFDLPVRAVQDADGAPLTFDLHIAWQRERTLPPSAYQFVQELSEFTRPLRMRRVGSSDPEAGHAGPISPTATIPARV